MEGGEPAEGEGVAADEAHVGPPGAPLVATMLRSLALQLLDVLRNHGKELVTRASMKKSLKNYKL